jgi:Holliday junction resolvase RusA-like endonuclease
MLSLTLPGPPIPFKSPYVGRKGVFNPRHKEMALMKAQLRSQYAGKPLEGHLIVDMFFHMPIPKCASKKQKEAMLKGLLRHTKKPDIDNLRKIVSDVLQEIVIVNDSQIFEGFTAKMYSENPRTVINIFR